MGTGFCWRCGPARIHGGRASVITLSKESTNADRLRDFRKMRREGNNEVATWPARLVLELAPTPYIQWTATLQAPPCRILFQEKSQ